MLSLHPVKTLENIGEREAIEKIFSLLTKKPFVAIGPGDDCAALQINDDYILLTTDMISQQTHIFQQMTPYQLGWFIVAINLSDIAAKGGKPLGVLLSYGLPKNTATKFITELTRGANKCATDFNTFILGGDLKETTELCLCGTAIGKVNSKEFMPRLGIQQKDIIAVTGDLGTPSAIYYKLREHNKLLKNRNALFQPIPRLAEGQFLATHKKVHACMDISDGVSASLYQLKQINNIGFEIYEKRLPISQDLIDIAEEISIKPTFEALHFGGEYELLLAIPPEHFQLLKDTYEKKFNKLTAIGVAMGKQISLVNNLGAHPLENKGYEHFTTHYFQ